MKRSTKVILSGAALFFAALWGGSFAQPLVKETWASFPTFATAFLLGWAGIFTVMFGIIERKEIDKEDRK